MSTTFPNHHPDHRRRPARVEGHRRRRRRGRGWHRGPHARSPARTSSRCEPRPAADVDAAVGQAAEAFLTWREVPAPIRGQLVKRWGELLTEHKADLAALVTAEVGKITSEALGEVQEMIDICDLAVGQSRQLFGKTMPSERPGHRLAETWHPLGVVGVISAFNFPVAVYAWNTALALICRRHRALEAGRGDPADRTGHRRAARPRSPGGRSTGRTAPRAAGRPSGRPGAGRRPPGGPDLRDRLGADGPGDRPADRRPVRSRPARTRRQQRLRSSRRRPTSTSPCAASSSPPPARPVSAARPCVG